MESLQRCLVIFSLCIVLSVPIKAVWDKFLDWIEKDD